MQRILEILAQEDREKLFTGDTHPNIYDAVAPIANTHDHREIEKTLKHYFEQMLQITAPGTRIHEEAQRMLGVCGKISLGVEEKPARRELSDEIVDFYMDSLKHFASYVDENVINEHIEYLEGYRR